MSITSLPFYILLLVVWAVYYLLPIKYRWYSLLVGSVAFYASYGYIAGLVLLASSFATYCFANLFEKKRKKAVLALYVIVCLLPLLFAKFSPFVANKLFVEKDFSFSLISLLGVSFYTFSSVSYLVDVYNQKISAQKNYGKLLLFLSFFPYILQGPIARYKHLEKQLYDGNEFSFEDNASGLILILWGIIKKLIIAERIGLVVKILFDDKSYYSTAYVVLAAVLYAFQLYMDFSGYVNIAEGVANLFSVKLQKNFKTPYFSRNISEFWRNWHATLGAWLRDYIYIPLGGNRKGTVRKCLNIFIVFLVSGIWHGNTWTFVLWGCYHGVLSVIHSLANPLVLKLHKKLHISEESWLLHIIQMFVNSAFVCVGWIFFRASTVTEAFQMLSGIFNFESVSLGSFRTLCRTAGLTEYAGKIMVPFILAAVVIELLQYHNKVSTVSVSKWPKFVICVASVVMIVSIICFSVQGGGAFMYEVF